MELVPKNALKRPVTLEEIKQIPKLKEMALLRLSRLSVQPVRPPEFREILRVAGNQ